MVLEYRLLYNLEEFSIFGMQNLLKELKSSKKSSLRSLISSIFAEDPFAWRLIPLLPDKQRTNSRSCTKGSRKGTVIARSHPKRPYTCLILKCPSKSLRTHLKPRVAEVLKGQARNPTPEVTEKPEQSQ